MGRSRIFCRGTKRPLTWARVIVSVWFQDFLTVFYIETFLRLCFSEQRSMFLALTIWNLQSGSVTGFGKLGSPSFT